uniref:GTP-binding protein RAD n=1 Tax=Parastrongyloides trichosuri TaxID=131310 RepID=A0A0N5A484_PARTI
MNETEMAESRRASLPTLSCNQGTSNRLMIPQNSINMSSLLENVAEFQLDPPYFSQYTSSSAETSPRILSPFKRPLSAKLYRKHINLDQMHNFNDDYEDECELPDIGNKKKVKFSGAKGCINKIQENKFNSIQQKSINLKNFIISKRGEVVENKTDIDKADKNRRATCPEIWLSSDNDTDDVNKTILRIYGVNNVGKHALTVKLTNYAYPHKCPVINEQKQIGSKKEIYSRKIQFLLNTKLHELEIVQGSALESDPFQNIVNLYMVVYSVDDKESFNIATQTLNRLVENNRNTNPAQILLVANKIDLQRKRKVSKLEGKTLAKIYNCSFTETSSLLGVNIDVLWKKILRNIQQRKTNHETLLSRIINNGRRFTKSCEEIVAKLTTLQTDSAGTSVSSEN